MNAVDPSDQPDAIRLNNHGVRNITRGNYQNAIKVLSIALGCAKKKQRSRHAAMMECNLNRFMVREKDPTTKHGLSGHPIDYGHYTKDKSETLDDFVYMRPIEIPLWYARQSGHRSNTTVATTIVFNLALAHHMLAIAMDVRMRQSSKGMFRHPMSQDVRTTLDTAVQMYELAVALNWKQKNTEAWAPLFLLATVNNMGRIYHVLNHKRKSQECFQHLLQYLMLFSQLNCGRKSDYEAFFGSVSHLIFQECCIPAAAA